MKKIDAPRREKGTGTLWQDDKGKWHLRREIGPNPKTGKRRFVTAIAATKTEAREKLNRKIEELQAEGTLAFETIPTLEQYTQRWLNSIRAQIKPRVFKAYESEINQINQQIGRLPLDQLTSSHIEYALALLSQKRSSKTIHNYYIRIRQILTQAVQEKLIPINPAYQMRPPRYIIKETTILQPGQPAQALTTLKNATFKPNTALALADDEEKEMWDLMWHLAFETGMRQAERFGLTPSELVTQDGIHGIQVTHQLQRLTKDAFIPNWLPTTHIQGSYYLLPPKTKQGKRFIPISTQLWIGLNQQIQQNHTQQNQLIFTLNGQPLNSQKERRRWQQTLQAAGLPYTTMRAARHFFSTQLAQIGASEDARISMMGHAKITTTAGYTHWTPAALAQLADQARQAVTQ
ncbi:tyrosine-type recombinase/integrase [Alloscardovia omnicolens]|uniref:tyrosine-type recombinase/integrase n=1 Tax=Alloscardovia omnicolens TaxID=419015 RepID=UPI00066763BD|nr:tyrosine-type recombinase/integrase [Alloscardovia omnicolens]MDK6327626.1 tyrosine-type recombinase/integrase [Alloscardovia omnicolens]MDK8073684.1 tyrosine-type recombinase/integrase [Alloscardovia omnicolens]MDK8081547.1 tyrosine-type recombinase/integrase [Alloscardovia omnicolens]